MEFDSVEEALEFYKNYAYRTGVGVVKRSNHKKKKMHVITFACK